ncbi:MULTISPECIES: transposase family protein [unclassified Streptomyces]|uniref:transposase family protein n=1 Tax=unclassified Streptomyces TaxID=2593676 RepID=UPI0038107719
MGARASSARAGAREATPGARAQEQPAHGVDARSPCAGLLVRSRPLHHHPAIGEIRRLLAERGCTISPGVRLRTLAEVIDPLGASGQTDIIDGTEIRVRRPAAGRKDREKFISGKNKQNAVKTMVITDPNGRVLFSSPARPGSCADITHARRLGLVKLLADGPVVEILADAGYQGLGAQTGGRVVTPPHRKFKKDAPDW